MRNLFVLFSLIFLLAGCGGSSDLVTNEEPVDQPVEQLETPVVDESEEVEEPQELIEVSMSVTPIIDGGRGTVYFQGETNLPDDAELMFIVKGNDGFSAQSKEFVYDGEFETEEFSFKGEAFPVGEYQLSVSLSISSTQEDSFVEIAGENYQFLVGDLMEESDLGKTMKYETFFAIDKEFVKEYISIDEVKETIEYYALGDQDELISVNIENGEIKATISMGPSDMFEPKDIAVNRYSQLSDELLNRDDWEILTIDFPGIGKVSMNRSESESNEYGDYFPMLEIENRMK